MRPDRFRYTIQFRNSDGQWEFCPGGSVSTKKQAQARLRAMTSMNPTREYRIDTVASYSRRPVRL